MTCSRRGLRLDTPVDAAIALLFYGELADPREAARAEVASIRSLPFVPQRLVVHGLLYDLASGNIEVVVNGYEAP